MSQFKPLGVCESPKGSFVYRVILTLSNSRQIIFLKCLQTRSHLLGDPYSIMGTGKFPLPQSIVGIQTSPHWLPVLGLCLPDPFVVGGSR